jgi:hypothetical protein
MQNELFLEILINFYLTLTPRMMFTDLLHTKKILAENIKRKPFCNKFNRHLFIVSPCSLVRAYEHSGGTFCPHYPHVAHNIVRNIKYLLKTECQHSNLCFFPCM